MITLRKFNKIERGEANKYGKITFQLGCEQQKDTYKIYAQPVTKILSNEMTEMCSV